MRNNYDIVKDHYAASERGDIAAMYMPQGSRTCGALTLARSSNSSSSRIRCWLRTRWVERCR